MNFTRAKILMLAICFLAIFFFSNDFGLIDVEKASIVTAIAIDKADDEYEVSRMDMILTGICPECRA